MIYIISILTFMLDQVAKWYVRSHFRLGESVPVVPDVFHWTYIVNHGAAFGVLMHQRWILLLVVVLLLGAMYVGRKGTIICTNWYRYALRRCLGECLGPCVLRWSGRFL